MEITKDELIKKLVEERNELLDRIHKLDHFIEKAIDRDVYGGKKQLELLTTQVKAMYDYLITLNLRIDLIKNH